MKRIIIPPGVLSGERDLILEIPATPSASNGNNEDDVYVLESRTSAYFRRNGEIDGADEEVNRGTQASFSDYVIINPEVIEGNLEGSSNSQLFKRARPLSGQNGEKKIKKLGKFNKLSVFNFPLDNEAPEVNSRDALAEPNIPKSTGYINTSNHLMNEEQSTSEGAFINKSPGDYRISNDSQVTIIGYNVSHNILTETWTDKPYLLNRNSFMYESVDPPENHEPEWNKHHFGESTGTKNVMTIQKCYKNKDTIFNEVNGAGCSYAVNKEDDESVISTMDSIDINYENFLSEIRNDDDVMFNFLPGTNLVSSPLKSIFYKPKCF